MGEKVVKLEQPEDFFTKENPGKKITLGQQVLDNYYKYAGQKTQTVRETTNEMGTAYMDSLWKVIGQHEHLREPYYIMEVLQPETFLEGVIKLKHIARHTRPRPEWGIAIYKVDNQSGVVTYEWGLPRAEEAVIMMSNPGGWDPKVIQDITDFVNGKLE